MFRKYCALTAGLIGSGHRDSLHIRFPQQAGVSGLLSFKAVLNVPGSQKPMATVRQCYGKGIVVQEENYGASADGSFLR